MGNWMIKDTEHFRLQKRFSMRREKFGGLIRDSEKTSNRILNETAFDLIKLLNSGYSIGESARALSKFYKVGLDRVRKDAIEALESNQEILERMKDSKVQRVEKSAFNFIATDHRVRFISWHLRSPIFVTFYPTFRCNLSCRFCFLPHSWRKDYVTMSFRDARKIADKLAENEVFEIQVLGGEPFLVKWMPSFLEYLGDLDMDCSLTTNGTVMDPKLAVQLSKLDRLHVNVSLEGASEKTHDSLVGLKGAYNSCVTSIKALVENNVDTSVASVALQENKNEISEVVNICSNIGIKKFAILYMYRFGNASTYPGSLTVEEFWNLMDKLTASYKTLTIHGIGAFNFLKSGTPIPRGHIFRQLGALFCKAGTTKFDVLPNGDVVPCVPLCRPLVGNLLRNDFAEIWEDQRWDLFRFRDSPKECALCKYSETCQGGCSAYRLEKFGSLERSDSRCPVFRG